MDIGLKRVGISFWSIKTASKQLDDPWTEDCNNETIDNNFDRAASLLMDQSSN